jgi:2',3'-cyclic-nucleotide 2'-phosphodiesterase
MNSSISILFLGDVVGRPGRRVVSRFLGSDQRPDADLIIINAENSAHGFGVTEQNIKELFEAGAHVLTGGNHTFDRKEVFSLLENYPFVLRPANYPENTAGRGLCIYPLGDIRVAVINLLGRVFMEPMRSPFHIADELVAQAKTQTDIIFVDMHAEATAEKIALALYLDGRVSAVAGTHTHVQTADERILPQGTAFITDAGCCGPRNSVIGMDQQAVFRRLIQQLPSRFEVASGPASACGILVKVDTKTGKALAIERIHYEEAYVPEDDAKPDHKNGKNAVSAQVAKQPETEEAKS